MSDNQLKWDSLKHKDILHTCALAPVPETFMVAE